MLSLNPILKNLPPKSQIAFKKLNEPLLDKWSEATFEYIYLASQLNYSQLKENECLLHLILMTPRCWVLYLEDQQFVQELAEAFESKNLLPNQKRSQIKTVYEIFRIEYPQKFKSFDKIK